MHCRGASASTARLDMSFFEEIGGTSVAHWIQQGNKEKEEGEWVLSFHDKNKK